MKQEVQETALLIIVLQGQSHWRSICYALAKRFKDRSILAKKIKDRFIRDPGLVDIPKEVVDWETIAGVFMVSQATPSL